MGFSYIFKQCALVLVVTILISLTAVLVHYFKPVESNVTNYPNDLVQVARLNSRKCLFKFHVCQLRTRVECRYTWVSTF